MNKDMSVLLALELNNKDIISLCLTNKIFNKYVCENEFFWLQKIRKDFPEIKDIKKYGETYKEAYKVLSDKIYIEISVNIVKDEDEDEDEDEENYRKEINIGKVLGFDRKWDIKTIVENALNDFFERISLFGFYDVYMDGQRYCSFVKQTGLSYCLEEINEDTESIRVVLDTTEYIDENDEEDYQQYLDESFADSIKIYLEKL